MEKDLAERQLTNLPLRKSPKRDRYFRPKDSQDLALAILWGFAGGMTFGLCLADLVVGKVFLRIFNLFFGWN